MSVRQLALPLFVSMTFAISGCNKISDGLKMEQSGGNVKNVSLSAPNKRGLSTNRGEMNWRVPPGPAGAQSQPIDLSDAINGGWRPWGAAVSLTGRAVITYTNPRDRSDGNATRMAVIDVGAGKIESAWRAPDLSVPLDIHPDGQTAVLCRQDAALSSRETLYIYRLPSEGSPEVDVWRPLVPESESATQPNPRMSEIRWLKFAGPERVVTLNDNHTIHVWEYPSKKRLVSIPKVVGTPALSPDGSRVAFLTDDMLALLDPSVPGVVAMRRVGSLPREPLIAFRADGRRLAITGTGKTTVLDFESGRLSHSEIGQARMEKGKQLMPDLAWTGRFLYRNERLYDFDSPQPLWHFTGIEWAMPEGDRMWSILRSKSNRHYVLQPIQLPLDKVETRLPRFYRRPDAISLSPGDRVRIDVAAIPENRQAEIRELLRKRLSKSGFKPSDQGSITLRASIDKPRKSAAAYVKFGGAIAPPLADTAADESRTFYFNRQAARLQFVRRNRVLWASAQYIFPPVWMEDWPADQFLADVGGPDYTLFESRQLPTYLRGTRTSVLGRTQVLAE